MNNRLKETLRILLFVVLMLLLIIAAVFFINASSIPVRIKVILIDIFLILGCIHYRRERIPTDDSWSIVHVIKWYTVIVMIIIVTIAVFLI